MSTARGDGSAWLDLVGVDPIAAMRELLVEWHPGPEPRVDRSVASEVPAALAELYAIAVDRPEVLGTQNGVYPLSGLRTDPHEGLLVFAAENQGNFSWLIDPTEDDPVVWRVAGSEPPEAEREPLSGFLVQFCLFEVISSGLQAIGRADSPAQARRLTATLREVPLAPWRWPVDPTRFFVAPDLVLCTGTDEDGLVHIAAAARSPAALALLADSDVRWDHFDDQDG